MYTLPETANLHKYYTLFDERNKKLYSEICNILSEYYGGRFNGLYYLVNRVNALSMAFIIELVAFKLGLEVDHNFYQEIDSFTSTTDIDACIQHNKPLFEKTVEFTSIPALWISYIVKNAQMPGIYCTIGSVSIVKNHNNSREEFFKLTDKLINKYITYQNRQAARSRKRILKESKNKNNDLAKQMDLKFSNKSKREQVIQW